MSSAVIAFNDAALYARQYYGQHADAAFRAHGGNALGWFEATLYDMVGGFVALGTGSSSGVAGPAGLAQSLWSVALAAPLGTLEAAVLEGQLVFGTRLAPAWQTFAKVASSLQIETALTSAANVSALAFAKLQSLSPVDGLLRLVDFAGMLGWHRLANFYGERSQGLAGNPYRHQVVDLQAWDIAAQHVVKRIDDIMSATTWFTSGATDVAEHVTEVGGVLFDRCDAMLCDIAEISGGYWDEQRGSLVLMGKEAQSGRSLTSLLAPADVDHLRIALRAALSGASLGVSIDPEAKYRHGMLKGQMLPDGAPMLVSYLGGTEGTWAGAILFEADRVLKNLASGVDNVSRKPIVCDVPGYQDLLSMPDRSAGASSWHRFWFVIDRVQIRKDPASTAFLVGDVRLKVLNETERRGQAPGATRSLDDDAFCRHLTEHYDAYAACFPVLARLEELARIAALSKYLVGSKIPLDCGTLFRIEPRQVPTPERTPAYLASRSVQSGGILHTRLLCGGVDLSVEPEIVIDRSGTVAQALQPILAARASVAATAWRVRANSAWHRATAHRLGMARKAQVLVCTDHTLAPKGQAEGLSLRRSYRVEGEGGRSPGRGWTWWVPYALTVVAVDGKRSEVLSPAEAQVRATGARCLVLHPGSGDESVVYREVGPASSGSGRRFCKVVASTGARSSYDPADAIEQQGTGFRWHRDGAQFTFQGDGRLIEAVEPSGATTRYQWQSGELVQTSSGTGAAYRFVRESGAGSRVSEVHVSNGDRISYGYDATGLLLLCAVNGRIVQRCRYDHGQRLVEIRDAADAVVQRLAYDAAGELVTTSHDVLPTADGSTFTRQFSRPGFVDSIVDQTGAKALFRYGAAGALESLTIQSASGLRWQLGFDAAGRMTELTAPTGMQARIERDRSGRVSRLCASTGDALTIAHGADGRIAGLTTGTGQHLDFTEQLPMPIEATAIGAGPTRRQRVCLRAPGEPARTLEVDAAGRPRSVRVGRSRPVRIVYDDAARSATLTTPAGRLRWTYDGDGLTRSLTFLD